MMEGFNMSLCSLDGACGIQVSTEKPPDSVTLHPGYREHLFRKSPKSIAKSGASPTSGDSVKATRGVQMPGVTPAVLVGGATTRK